MNFLTASVEITVDDKPVKVKLSEIKRAFSQTASESESVFKKAFASIQSAFSSMVHYAKWGGVAIAGALALATREAMKQENAMFALMGALKASGEYNRETVSRLNEFANAMQEVTTYADEEVLAIMQTASVLGVQSNQLRLAAKWTIALSDAVGMGTETASRLVAMALKGEYTMLRRYIPALREARTTTESFQTVQEFMNRAFEVSTTKAQTTSGALKQMRNALSEVGEAIGYAILPTLKSVAEGIRDWAMRNRETIAYWANLVMAYVTFAKDVFIDFAKYLITDWQAGWRLASDITITILRGLGESLSIVLSNAAVRAADQFMKIMEDRLWKPLRVLKYIPAVYVGAKWVEFARPKPEELAPIGPQVSKIAQQTTDEIKTIVDKSNLDIKNSTNRLKDRLLEIEQYKVEGFSKMEQDMADKSVNLASETSAKIKEINDSLVQEVKNAQQNLIERELKERWKSFTESMQNSLSSAFERLIFEGESFKDFMKNLTVAILQDFIRIQFIRPAAEQLGTMLAGFGAKIGMMTLGIPPVPAGEAHSGLNVGEYTANRRLVPAHLFAGANRYGWLRPGEEAIIADKGERISRGASPVNVSINLQAIDTQSGIQFLSRHERLLANIIQSAMRKNHPYRRS